MPGINVRFRALTARTPQLVPIVLAGAVRVFQQQWANNVISDIKNYPPPPSGSTYVRTNRLFFGWHVVSGAGGFTVNIVNNVPYAGFVQGDQQTWFHEQTGWLRIREHLDRDGYRAGLQGVISSHIRRLR